MAYGGLAREDGINALEAGLWNATWFVSTEIGPGVVNLVHPQAPGDSLRSMAWHPTGQQPAGGLDRIPGGRYHPW